MWSSLNACHPTTIESGGVSGSKSIQLPSQGQVSYVPSSAHSVVTTTTTLLDGLVLSFASSPDTSRIHCFDVTVRCNPSQLSSSATDELDGWRGYWTPITPTIVRQQQQPGSAGTASQSVDLTSSGVVAMAACRIPTSKRQEHSTLHIASLGLQNQLVVCVDPHLHLSCRLPVHDTTTSTDTFVVYTVPTGSKWNSSSDGTACVLDIAPGMVAVGTSTGVVLVYAYDALTTSTTTTTVGITTKNKQLSRMLRPYLRIPPPPVSDVSVVSIQLSISPSNNKIFAFVSYNRAPRTTSPTSVNTNNATTAAGICCYDLPLPTNSFSSVASTTSAPTQFMAPLSRHDLDGRFISSSELVDSYERRHGGRMLTVVTYFKSLMIKMVVTTAKNLSFSFTCLLRRVQMVCTRIPIWNALALHQSMVQKLRCVSFHLLPQGN
jgi:hypothetical protein